MTVTGGRFDRMGPLACLGPFPVLLLDKVRFVCSHLRCSTSMSMSEIKVPNKSLSHELNNVLFADVLVV